jgi:hypothetical protein
MKQHFSFNLKNTISDITLVISNYVFQNSSFIQNNYGLSKKLEFEFLHLKNKPN